MEIKSRLEALHIMACMRRMELEDKDDSKEWNVMFEAIDHYFDPLRTSWSYDEAVQNNLDPLFVRFAYLKPNK